MACPASTPIHGIVGKLGMRNSWMWVIGCRQFSLLLSQLRGRITLDTVLKISEGKARTHQRNTCTPFARAEVGLFCIRALGMRPRLMAIRMHRGNWCGSGMLTLTICEIGTIGGNLVTIRSGPFGFGAQTAL